MKRYIYVQSLQSFNDLRPASALRLIYIGTFLGEDGYIYEDEDKKVKATAESLEHFIGFAQRQYWLLLEDEIKDYIQYDSDGYAMIDPKIMTIVEPENWRRNYQRVSTKIVRYFAEARANSYKVYAGYVIQMLPYINHEWGILCDDIFEDEMDEIKTLSLYKLCHFAGYHWRRVPRFKDELSKLTFPINGVRERVFNFIPVGEDVGASQVMVNPRFVYSGNDRSTEKQLIKLFQYKED